MTIQTALQQGTELLEQASIPVPRLTAEVLLAHALHQDRTFLYSHASDDLSEHAWIHYGRYLNERMEGKPTQYVTHLQEFYGREFHVDSNVLIPRPETEHLVETALAYLSEHPVRTVVDVGTGSGAIAISIALESGRSVMGSDISTAAVAVAERNRRRHSAHVRFFGADLLQPLRPASLDLLVSNPPYVPGADAANMQREVREWEPHVALFAGDSGFEIYKQLLMQAEIVVKRGGRIMMELGYQSLSGVKEMLEARWTDICVISDLAGWPRVIAATLSHVP